MLRMLLMLMTFVFASVEAVASGDLVDMPPPGESAQIIWFGDVPVALDDGSHHAIDSIVILPDAGIGGVIMTGGAAAPIR